MAGLPLLASILVLTALIKNHKPSPNPATVQGLATQSPLSRILGVLVNIPTAKVRVKLYCRTGFHLVVLPGGHVRGTFNSTISNTYGRFELQSHAQSIIRMKNLATKRYIGINSRGRVFATTTPTKETLLKETHHQNYFHSFRSHIYKSKFLNMDKFWYLAIKKNGKMKNARRVLPNRHKSFHFLTLEERTPDQHNPRQSLENTELRKLIESLLKSRL